jgi:hypothetical protein
MIALVGAAVLAAEGTEVVAPEVLVGFGPGVGAGAGASPGVSGGVLGAWFPTRQVGVQALVREGYWAAEPRFVGQIGFAPRWRASPRLDAWLGFVHHHETPLDVVKAEPIGAIGGTADGILHRSGVDLGFSWGFPLGEPGERASGVGRLEFSTSAFPDDAGPVVYGQVWLTVTLEVRELRRGG